MEKTRNCLHYMFSKCIDENCQYGHVILTNKQDYLNKLRGFDFMTIERTCQTRALLFLLKELNDKTVNSLQEVCQFLLKLNEKNMSIDDDNKSTGNHQICEEIDHSQMDSDDDLENASGYRIIYNRIDQYEEEVKMKTDEDYFL